MFQKYMHVERFGSDEVEGIELGECYVFPKIDGTNGSVWWDGNLRAGSRNRELSADNDNAGFYQWVLDNPAINKFCQDHKTTRLFGEFLVPHSLKTYRDDAWRKFYVFDVFDEINQEYMPYGHYSETLEEYEIDFVPPLCVMRNATHERLLQEIEKNVFLIKDGCGFGEGIVIKNYAYQNRFGKTVWAKLVANEFKEKHAREMGPTIKNMKQMVEQEICDKYVTQHLVDKVYAKIVTECDGWNSRYIPRLLQTVFYDLVNEELWNIVKEMKNPTINFKTLNSIVIIAIKKLRPELF